jgi:hypothetical protein
MKNTHTLRTFYDGCELTLRYDGDTAHFELWIPGEEDQEPLATIPAIGGELEWTPRARDLHQLLNDEACDAYAGIIRSIAENFAALQGDRRRYQFFKKWNVWDRRFC